MAQYLYYLIPLALLGVVTVLALGLISYSREGQKARERSNRLMQWRIILQFVAVVLIVVFVLILQGG